ncbi:MAG: hypothetical protein DRJ42_16950, partial [Deltaproteobacteria bacterium]
MLSLVLVAACAAEDPEHSAEARTSAIINGERITSLPEVVLVVRVNSRGDVIGLCSGTAIGPRHVLTAKHCVYDEVSEGNYRAIAPGSLRVGVGHDVSRPSSIHVVDRVYASPGADVDMDISIGRDIAVVQTSTAHGAPLREVARAQPRTNNPVEIVGFGRTSTTSGASGLKYRGTTRVKQVFLGVFSTDGVSWTCQGDSGGPAFDAVGRIVGVTSFGEDESCSISEVYFSDVSYNIELIESAIGTAACTSRPEICNGADDDCNGIVDDGCGGLGEACFGDDECESGACRLVGGDPVCVQDCNPATNASICPTGYVCEITGCDIGSCVAGTPGPAAVDAPCTADADCATSWCVDAPDGGRRCAQQCTEGGSSCPEARVCVTDGFPCGECRVPVPGDPLPFGSACAVGTDCIDGLCRGGFCSRSCTTDPECPASHRCSAEVCVAGEPRPPGALCIDAAECGTEAPVCAEVDFESVCVAECSDGSCTDDYLCEGGLCVPPG